MRHDGISIVIPVYNGGSTLEKLVHEINEALSGFSSIELILVDDSSTDDSLKIAKSLSAKQDNILAISLDGNYGQQSAILCGLRHASMEYTVIMDDDLEHNPLDILKLYEEIKKGHDVVYALNSLKTKKSLVRKIGSGLRDKTFDYLTKKPKDIKVCSFRILNRNIVNKVIKANTKFVYISMEILKYTSNIVNIKVKYGTRRMSGHSMGKLIKLLINIFVYYSGCKIMKTLRKTGPAYVEVISSKKDS